MSTANLRSIDALVQFRGELLNFIAVARQSLEMLEVQARQGVEYITKDRAHFWKYENRRSWDGLTQAKDAYRQARIQRMVADRVPDCVDEKKAIQRAELRLKTSEQKLQAVKRWSQEADHAWNEFQGRYSQTLGVLDGDLPHTVAVLEKIITQIEKYMQTSIPTTEQQSPT
jgi:hypothetical protein